MEESAAGVGVGGDVLGILCVARDGQGPSFIALSTNAGRTFAATVPLHMIAPEQIAVNVNAGIAVGNGGITGGGRFDYELALSGNGGRSWRLAIRDREQVAEGSTIDSLEFVTSRDVSWVGDPYFAWRSSDGGKTWRRIPAP